MSDNHKHIAYRSDMGHKATVKREDLTNAKSKQSNESLAIIGKHLSPPGLQYVGSAAVHVYLRKGIIGDELAFICQPAPLVNQVQSPVADDAILELSKQVKKAYTGTMEVKRSGF